MRLFGSAAVAAGVLDIEIPKGSYRALILELVGVNNTGVTLTNAEVGRLRITRGGIEQCNMDFVDLLNFNNADGGVAFFTSTVAAAVNAQARFLFYMAGDLQNIMKFERGEGRINFQFNPAAMTKLAGAGSGTMNIYGVTSKGVEKYQIKTFEFSQLIGASGSISTPLLSASNVDRIYFRTASQFSQIQIQKDDIMLITASGDALKNDTAFKYRLETAPAFIIVDMSYTKSYAELISDKTLFYLTSTGAGTAVIIYQTVEFNAQRTAISKASTERYFAKEIVRDPQVAAIVRQEPVKTAIAVD